MFKVGVEKYIRDAMARAHSNASIARANLICAAYAIFPYLSTCVVVAAARPPPGSPAESEDKV